MIQDRTDGNGANSNNELGKLMEALLANYPLCEEILNSLVKDISFEVNRNEIRSQQVLDEIEAVMLSEAQDTISDSRLKEIVIKSVHKCVENKMGKNKKKQVGKKDPQVNDLINQSVTDSVNKEYTFNLETVFNEKSLSNTRAYNSKDITPNFFSNFELKEYDLVPKDEDSYYEEYAKYFEKRKTLFLQDLGIEQDNSLLDVDKFILLVTFENDEGKPLLSDIVLIDPLKNFQRYLLKIENENISREYYFFNGQIIFIEGHCKSNEIFAQKILFGQQPTSYSLDDSYVRGFFQDPSPYCIYVLNGPFMDKSNVDLTVFLKTLTHIAQDNPHALIISGPILSVENAVILSGDINCGSEGTNYFDLFESILNEIVKIFSEKRTHIILSPSLADVTSFYPLPQPPYNLNYLRNANNNNSLIRDMKDNKKRLHLISNPQIFQLNEIVLGAANFEVAKDMMSNSIRSQPQDIAGKGPIDSALEMILMQRNFYPILPNNTSEDIDKMDKLVTVDERKLLDMHLEIFPDIIITPNASMQPYVKKFYSTLFINPSSLYRNNNLGSFMKITSYPPDNVSTDIISRLKVDVIKVALK